MYDFACINPRYNVCSCNEDKEIVHGRYRVSNQ